MSQADGVGQTAPDERSTGELVKQVAEQVSVLVRDELKLTQLEMTRKGRQAGTGIGDDRRRRKSRAPSDPLKNISAMA